MYLDGRVLHQDFEKAVFWLTRAAEQGHAFYQYTLGEKYYYGENLPQDYKKAVYWFTKAAERGNTSAQFNLGLMYLKGEGLPQDNKQGFYWITNAAEQGHAKAQAALGIGYYYGQEISQDYKQAVYWLTKAAEQGYVFAQTGLGVSYYNGQGVTQNHKLAYVWFSLAASKGDEIALKGRDSLANKMTPQMLVEAQDLAAKFQEKIKHQIESSKTESCISKSDNTYEPEAKGFGSGFIISKDGYVLTCYHVIIDSGTIKVKVGDNLHPAKLVNKDLNNDLALLKISGQFPALAFSSNRTAKMGQEVFTIGYPNPILQGVNEKLTKGSINSLTGFQDDIRLYQISVPVQPGNSGGPLLDMNGNVIGMVVAMLDASTAFKVSGSLPQNVNYAIKSTYVQALIDTLPEISGDSYRHLRKKLLILRWIESRRA